MSSRNTYAYARYSWIIADENGYTPDSLIHAFLDYCHHISVEEEKDRERAGERLLVFNLPVKERLRWRLLICGEDSGMKYAEIDLPVQSGKLFDTGPFELMAANLRIALNGWEETPSDEKEAFLALMDQFWKEPAGE